jgi:hypothetical protein
MRILFSILFSVTAIVAFSQINQPANQNANTAQVATKRVLIEEGTGTWCIGCPWGIVRLEEMNKKYTSTTAIVSVHVKGYTIDPMEDEIYEAGIRSNFAGGVPTGLIDRAQTQSISPDDFEKEYLKRIAYAPAIDVFIDKISFNSSTRLLSFNVNAATVAPFNGAYRFNAILTEMQVHGTTSDYDQANIYSGDNTPMGGFEKKPDPVPAKDMYYDFVGRAILGGWDGTANSIPSTNASGQTISYTYTTTIPAGWNEKKLSIIGFVINSTNGSVKNSSLPTNLGSITGIDADEKTAFIAYPNPTSGLISIRNASTMDITIFDITGSQILKTAKNTTQIDISDLANGIYFLQFNDGKERCIQKFTLIK